VAFWYQTGEPTFKARAPHAKERTLPNLDRTILARDFTDAKYHGAGEASVQEMDYLYPDGQLFYAPAEAAGGWVEIPFKVEKKEPKRLLLVMTRASDFGKYQAYLNGVKLGGVIDLYNPTLDSREFHLLDFWPEPGDYTLRLECVGKNYLSESNKLGVESVRLRERRPRVTTFGHEKDKDWNTEPKLYN